MTNLIEIVITGKNLAKPAMDSAAGDAKGLGGALDKMGLVSIAALGGIAVASIDMAAKFDSAMTRLQTQAQVPQGQIKQLSQGILGLASQVGASPDSLAMALYHVESNFQSMGISSAKALEIVKVAAEGAAVGNANLEDVTNALSAAVVSGIPGVQNMSQAMGVLNAIVGVGDMTMQNLADALGTGMVAVVKGYGLSIIDVGAAMATFGDNNIRGAVAATDFRMAVQALAVPAKAGSAELAKLGMTTTQMAADMQHGGLLKALEDLKAHMDAAGVSAVQQGQVITDIFGKKAGVGVAVLYGQLDRLKSKYPDLQKAAGTFGDAWNTQSQTMTQKLNDLKAGFDALMIEIGNRLIPVVMVLVGWMLKHSDAVVKILAGLGVFVAMLATYSIAARAAAVATTLWAVATGELDVAEAANPIGLIVIAVEALGVAIYELVTHWKQVTDFVKKYATEIEIALTVILGPFGAILAAALYLSMHWRQIMNDLRQWLWDDFARPVVDFFTQTVPNAFHTFMSVAQPIWDEFAQIVSTVWNTALKPVFDLIVAALRFGMAVAMMIWRDVFVTTWQGIAAVAKWAWETVLRPVLGFVVQQLRILGEVSMWLWHNVAEPAWRGFAAVAKWAWDNVVKPTLDFMVLALNDLGATAMWLWHQVIEPAFRGFGATISWVWNNVVKPVFDAFEGAVAGLTNMFNGLTNAINGTKAAAGMGAALSGAVNTIASSMGGAGGRRGGGGHALGMASGGSVGAAAWGGVQGGWTRMNEDGIELVRLPTGATVMPHANTMSMLAALLGAGGGGGTGGGGARIELVGIGDDLWIRALRNSIRVRGGNVQKVLGVN